MKFSRIILLILDGCGCGVQPDYRLYHNKITNTLGGLYQYCPSLRLPFLESLGLSQILKLGRDNKNATYGILQEASPGNDTLAGVFEMLGAPLHERFSSRKRGLGKDLLKKIRLESGIHTLCNRYISGYIVLDQYYQQHKKTANPIMYLSDDGVILLAGHCKIISPEKLNQQAERLSKSLFGTGYVRIITRPFSGELKKFTRMEKSRKDFMLAVLPNVKLLNDMRSAGMGLRITEHLYKVLGSPKGSNILCGSHHNIELMAVIEEDIAVRDEALLAYVLQDTDNIGHRKDPQSFCEALITVDDWLSNKLVNKLNPQDLLLITADHGCDPSVNMRGHSREYVPLLAYSSGGLEPGFLGSGPTFSNIGQTIAHILNLPKLDYGQVLDISPKKE